MKLYVLRHGQTNYNKEGRFQGQDDICLNEQGIIETKEIAKILGKIDFNKIYVSPLKRAIETAKIVFPKNSFEIDNRIIERSFGKLEGKKGIPDYEEKIEEFGIETVENLEKRIKSFLNCICKKHKENEKILVVTHGGIAQIINNILDKNYNNNNFKEFMLENSKYVCYEIKGGKNGY